MLTQKRHALDHLCETILEAGEIESLHGEIYEASHKRFKLFYDRSSRRKRIATDKIISLQNAENTEQFDFNFYRKPGFQGNNRRMRRRSSRVGFLIF